MTLDIAKSILETMLRSDHARLDLRSETEQSVFVELVRDATHLVAARLVAALPEGHPVLSNSVMAKFTPESIAMLPIASVQSVFSRLTVNQQRDVLAFLFQADFDRYQVCMDVSRLRWIRVGNRFVERVKAAELVDTMAQRLVSEILDPSVSVQELDTVCDRMQDEFEWSDVVDTLTQSLTHVLDRVPAMNSADDLKSFLKAHWLITQFPFAFPESLLQSIEWRTLVGLGQMPTTEWVLKVLNQFDEASIIRIVLRAEADQLSGDSVRRNPALKVLGATRELVDMPEFKTVRFAIGLESQQ